MAGAGAVVARVTAAVRPGAAIIMAMHSDLARHPREVRLDCPGATVAV